MLEQVDQIMRKYLVDQIARKYLEACTGGWSGVDPNKEALARAVLERGDRIMKLEAANRTACCAFCGERLAEDAAWLGEARTNALADHIRTCPKHPMRALEAEVSELREQLDRAMEQLPDGWGCPPDVEDDPNCSMDCDACWGLYWERKA
jgi:hypothetical protein